MAEVRAKRVAVEAVKQVSVALTGPESPFVRHHPITDTSTQAPAGSQSCQTSKKQAPLHKHGVVDGWPRMAEVRAKRVALEAVKQVSVALTGPESPFVRHHPITDTSTQAPAGSQSCQTSKKQAPLHKHGVVDG